MPDALDAEQPDAIAWVDARHQGGRHLSDGAPRADGAGEGVRAGLQGEVLELDLDRDGAGRASMRRAAWWPPTPPCAGRGARVRPGRDVLAEGLLMADRLGRSVRGSPGRVLAPGQRGQVGAASLAHPAHQSRRPAGRPGRPPCARRARAAGSPWPGPRPTALRHRDRAGTPLVFGVDQDHPGPGSKPVRLARGLAAREASLAIILERPMPTAQSSERSSRPLA